MAEVAPQIPPPMAESPAQNDYEAGDSASVPVAPETHGDHEAPDVVDSETLAGEGSVPAGASGNDEIKDVVSAALSDKTPMVQDTPENDKKESEVKSVEGTGKPKPRTSVKATSKSNGPPTPLVKKVRNAMSQLPNSF
jgi:hypothetical protein